MWLKRLAFALWLVVCVIIGFLITLISRRECLLKVCLKKANLILNDMDMSYKKCDNFYKFICGKYGLRGKEYLDESSIWEEMKNKQDQRLIKFLEEPIAKYDDRVLRIIKKIFRSCLNLNKIEKEGLRPLWHLIDKAGGFPLVDEHDWTNNLTTHEDWTLGVEEYDVREAGFTGGHIFRAFVEFSEEKHFVHISVPNHIEFDDAHFDDYFTYVKKIGLTLRGTAGKSFDKEINDTLQFKRELAKLAEVKRNCSTTVQRAEVKSIDDEFPYLTFKRFLTRMSVTGNPDAEIAFVESSAVGRDYIRAIKNIVERTPRRIINNYLMIENIMEVTPMLPASFRTAYEELLKKTKGKDVKIEKNRKILCVKCLKDKVVSALSALYLKRYFKDFTEQENLKQIVLALKTQMKKVVESVKWMDRETKKRALWKIDDLDFAAPVPKDVFEELTDKTKFRVYYEDLCFAGNDSNSLSGYVALQQFKSDKNWELLERPFEAFDYGVDIFTGEIQFDFERNVVVIPNAFMNYPAFNKDWPKYLNYGGFCSKVAMELIRGVDFEGRFYDAKGSVSDWWTIETKAEYGPQSRCFVNEYNTYLHAHTTTKIKDPNCILDDIAALAGVKVAFMAYEDYANRRFFKERQMPKLKQYTAEQLFFVDFATFYCIQNKSYYYNGMTELEASKSSNEYRVNNALRNLEAFGKHFECSKNDSMSPYAKCSTWGTS